MTRPRPVHKVIGAGVGGLTCACLLARAGHAVVLFEKERAPGGVAACFSHGGRRLPLGCNVSGPIGEGLALARFLRALGIEGEARPAPLDPDCCVRVHAGGRTLALPAGIERFAAAAADAFPADGKEIAAFGGAVRAAMRLLAAPDAGGGDSSDDTWHLLTSRETLAERLAPVRSAAARAVLSLFWRFGGMEPEAVPFSLYAPLMGAFLDGPCFLDGDRLAGALAACLLRAGGRIETGASVEGIDVREGIVTAIRLAGGERVPVEGEEHLVSTIHPRTTLELLGPGGPWRRRLARIEAAGETLGAFVAYFERPAPPAGDARRCWDLVLPERDGAWDPDAAGGAAGGAPGLAVFRSPGAREGTEAVRAMALVAPGVFSAWEGTRTTRRGDAYEEKKRAMAERVRRAAEAALPGPGGPLAHVAAVTPLTLRDRLGHRGGAYGIMRAGGGGRGLATCGIAAPAGRLLIGGQSARYPGIMGTIETGILAAGRVPGGAGGGGADGARGREG